MKSTKVEIHGILYLDVDIERLSESEIEELRLRMADHFRDGFDRMFKVGDKLANCTDCSVAVEVS